VAESIYEQAIRGQFPDVGLAPGYGSRDGYRQVGLGASIPIPIFNGNRQAVETALASRTAAAVDVERRLERTAADLAAARTAFDLAIRRLRLVEDELIPLVDTQFRELRTLADLGQFDTLVLLDGLVRRRDAVVGLIRGRRDAGLAANRILSIVGSPATEDDHAASSLEEPA
jgi:outer membrane protein TolC